MNSPGEISNYFQTLAPHTLEEHGVRDAQWALDNKEEIAEQLANRGPASWYSKIRVIGGSDIFTSPNAIDTTAETFFESFGLRQSDLDGKRVLDIGAFSGSMTFFAEDCGAEVVALDIQRPETNGFRVIHDLRQSTTTHVVASIYDLHPDLFGTFDVVIFSGVHYHLKHPLLGLERLNSVTRPGGALLTLGSAGDYWLHEPGSPSIGVDFSTVVTGGTATLNEIPLLAFYRDGYMQDSSNWFVPNTKALADMIVASGYEVLSAATFPTDLPEGGRIACAVILARKTGEPTAEYLPEVYAHVRKLAGGDGARPFTIPTWYELEHARRHS